ncbi:MAG: cyclic nucleotide-binding domain-containing protein [Thermoanaerobaculia bacterium]
MPAALALLFLSIAVILIVRTPSPLVVVIAAISALAGGSIAAAVLRASRQDVCAVTVEMPHEIPPERARKILLDALGNIEGLRNHQSSVCRVVGLGTAATVFEIACIPDDAAESPAVRSRILTRLWHARQRELSRDSDEGAAVLDALDATPLFVSLPAEIKEVMAADAEIEFWDAGEEVVRQDSPADACFIVRRGGLGVHVSNGSSTTRVATLAKGDLFGEMSLLTGEARWATVRTDEDSELVRIRPSALTTALKRSPELVQLLAETVATRRDAIHEARAGLDRPVVAVRAGD